MKRVLGLVAMAGLGCSEAGTGNARGRDGCALILRFPEAPFVVRAQREGQPTATIGVECLRPDCLRIARDSVAVPLRDGRVWMAWPGQPGTLVARETAPGEVLLRLAEIEATAPRFNDQPALPPPKLPPDLRTCGTVSVGGGFGWHVIRNADNTWQRIHWATPPTAPEVTALGPEMYPLTGSGRLCGYAVQKAPRMWMVHVPGVERAIEAAPDSEHPPAACLADGSMRVQTARALVLITPDGTEQVLATYPAPDPAASRGAPPAGPPGSLGHALFARGQATLWADGALEVRFSDGSTWQRPPPLPDQDLGGNPLRPGAVRKRALVVGTDRNQVAIAERIMQGNCRGYEALHVFNVDERSVTTLVKGDVQILRPGYAAGAFWWVEGSSGYRDVSRDDELSVSF